MRVPWFAISILASPYSVRVIEAVQLSDMTVILRFKGGPSIYCDYAPQLSQPATASSAELSCALYLSFTPPPGFSRPYLNCSSRLSPSAIRYSIPYPHHGCTIRDVCAEHNREVHHGMHRSHFPVHT